MIFLQIFKVWKNLMQNSSKSDKILRVLYSVEDTYFNPNVLTTGVEFGNEPPFVPPQLLR